MIDIGLVVARFLHFMSTITLAGAAFFPLYAYAGAEPETLGRQRGRVMLWSAVLGLLSGDAPTTTAAFIALLGLSFSYAPTVRYYNLNPGWILGLSLAACLFLAMTWTSAWRYWSGERSRWKNRSYDKIPAG